LKCLIYLLVILSSDRNIAKYLAEELENDGWDVFWDRKIEAGSEWNNDLQRALENTSCVIVLWSKKSKKSFWVQGEAANAFERDVYLPVLIDQTIPPELFKHVQTPSLHHWVQDNEDDEELVKLKSTISSRIGALPMYGNLMSVADGDPVNINHLQIVHSCWRVNKLSRTGVMPYQIHVIIFGHDTALERIDYVEYKLPGYPKGHERQRGGSREKLFELMELANGFSIIQADIHLKNKPKGSKKVLHLSRLVNMSESGPRLLNDFIRRHH